jgi:hypothetical protein
VFQSEIRYLPENVRLFWLLKEVGDRIDLSFLGTKGDRRDYPPGCTGRHLAADEYTCFREVNVRRDMPPRRTYLLCFTGELCLADCLCVPSATFGGLLYDFDHFYSQHFFHTHSGVWVGNGANALRRHSAPLLARGIEQSVVALFPEGIQKLKLEWIEPIGLESPDIPIIPLDKRAVNSRDYPRPAS